MKGHLTMTDFDAPSQASQESKVIFPEYQPWAAAANVAGALLTANCTASPCAGPILGAIWQRCERASAGGLRRAICRVWPLTA